MTKTQAIKAIDEAYFEVERVCECSSNWERWIEMHRQEERGHRRFCPDHVQCGLTTGQSVRLFAVKELFECITGQQYRPSPEEFFHVRGTIFGAWSLWKECGEKLARRISKDTAEKWLAEIDYAELNKDPRQLETA